jgi:hypothetical protein
MVTFVFSNIFYLKIYQNNIPRRYLYKILEKNGLGKKNREKKYGVGLSTQKLAWET